jgi:hypothetical protein
LREKVLEDFVLVRHSPACGNDIYDDICLYEVIEAAYENTYPYLDDPPNDAEEWLINLHNHLVLHSYKPGRDPAHDTIVLSAIDSALKRRGIQVEDADKKTRKIINYLTLE